LQEADGWQNHGVSICVMRKGDESLKENLPFSNNDCFLLIVVPNSTHFQNGMFWAHRLWSPEKNRLRRQECTEFYCEKLRK